MNFLRLAFRRETAAAMWALVFASAMAVLLVAARMAWSGELRYGFLIWNLFLAWLPLAFAFLAREAYGEASRRNQFYGWAIAWLLFFPNAAYIFTDLIHLTNRYYFQFWIDMMLILVCALTGLVLGFVSLYLMQSLVARRFGIVAGWLFVAGTATLSSVGVWIGRFLRLNSWDVVFRPVMMYRRIDAWIDGRLVHRYSIGFVVLFAAFVFLGYVMLYGLTHLAPGPATEKIDERR